MRFPSFLAGLGLAVLAHLVGIELFPLWPRVFDVFLVVVVLAALDGETLPAIFVGMLVGLLHDTLTGGLYGLHGFADTIVGYATARLAQRLVIQRATGVLAVVGFASVLQQAIIVALTFMMLPDPPSADPAWAGIQAGATGLLGMLVYVANGRWRASYESKRRSRMRRLRLE